MVAQLPAVVTIQDLPTGTTITGAELFEAVQTSGGVGQSIQVPISQIATTALGALPTGGGTGQFLQKSNATNFAAVWANIASNVLASTGLAQSGSTTVSLSLASTVGLSVLGVGGIGSAVPAAIAGTADQVFIINHVGNTALFGAVNLATTAAVTGVLPNAQYSSVNLASGNVAGGVQGVLPGANYSAANLASANVAGGVQGILPVTNGGTNTSTLTAFGVVYGGGTSTVGITAAGAGGQLLVGQTLTSAPSWQTISGAFTLSSAGTASFANIGQTILTTGSVHTTVTTEREIYVNRAATFSIKVTAATTFFAADTNGLPLIIADISGSASANNITINFLSDTCDGTSTLTIANNYGLFRIRPIATGNWIIV